MKIQPSPDYCIFGKGTALTPFHQRLHGNHVDVIQIEAKQQRTDVEEKKNCELPDSLLHNQIVQVRTLRTTS